MLKRNLSLFSLGLLFFAVSCGGEETTENNEESNDTDSVAVETTEEGAELAPGMTPWDFPTVGFDGQPGDYVLCPGYTMYTNALAEEDPANETMIFYTAEVSAAGDVESDIDFTFDDVQKMPNSILIDIPQGQTAEVGDIVLTWWQTGSGMQRAIVTEASDPTQPMVRYLDLDFDNPAEDSESGKSIGATEYQLKPNSFVKLTDPWQEGQYIACKDEDGDWNNAQIVKISGDKVLTIGFAGTMKVYAKADCRPTEAKPNVKAGDTVWADFAGGWSEGTVTEVDTKMGVVWVEMYSDPSPVSYGLVSTTEFK